MDIVAKLHTDTTFLNTALAVLARRDRVLDYLLLTIQKEFDRVYPNRYNTLIEENAQGKSISIWDRDFDDEDMCFVIEVGVYDCELWLVSYLYPHDKKRKSAMLPQLREILGVGDEVFSTESLQGDGEFFALADSYCMDLGSFSMEQLLREFDKMRDVVYALNHKIQDDLANQNTSKLAAFITDSK